MKATARHCAFAWLSVASAAIERAALCAAVGEIEALEEYVRMRNKLEAQIRQGWLRIRQIEILGGAFRKMGAA